MNKWMRINKDKANREMRLTKPQKLDWPIIRCAGCGALFQSNRNKRQFCSKECYIRKTFIHILLIGYMKKDERR